MGQREVLTVSAFSVLSWVKRSLKSLKKGKASGCDNIPPEAWKEGGMVSANVLNTLLNKMWNEEDIPQDWKVGLLVKLKLVPV